MISTSFMTTGALDPSALTRPTWTAEPMVMDETLDFKSLYPYDSYNNFDSNAMLLDPCVINPAAPMMSDWNDASDLDFSNFINNPVGA